MSQDANSGASPNPRGAHPVRFDVSFPDRELDRIGTAFRIILVIPIAIVLGTVGGMSWVAAKDSTTISIAGGLLFMPPLLLILFRRKYPRWWFEWNRELLRFVNRVIVYIALLDDRYPSTDEHQAVRLEFDHPGDDQLNRWLPLVKWLLVIPHYVVLIVLDIGVVLAVIIAWFAIVFTGKYPRGLFDFVVGVGRWHNRVIAYAVILVTDRYPPFRLSD